MYTIVYSSDIALKWNSRGSLLEFRLDFRTWSSNFREWQGFARTLVFFLGPKKDLPLEKENSKGLRLTENRTGISNRLLQSKALLPRDQPCPTSSTAVIISNFGEQKICHTLLFKVLIFWFHLTLTCASQYVTISLVQDQLQMSNFINKLHLCSMSRRSKACDGMRAAHWKSMRGCARNDWKFVIRRDRGSMIVWSRLKKIFFLSLYNQYVTYFQYLIMKF